MMQEYTYTAPIDFRMRPCAVIVRFFLGQQDANKGVSVSLLRGEKNSKATSILGLALLQVKKGDEVSLQIHGGSKEQVEFIRSGFAQLIDITLHI